MHSFFDFVESSDHVLGTIKMLMIVGDFNIHVDDVTDIHAGELIDLLTSHSSQQHVTLLTYEHSLDLLITRDHQTILPIDPPLLSDHSFVVAICDCLLLSTTDQLSSCAHRRRCSRHRSKEF